MQNPPSLEQWQATGNICTGMAIAGMLYSTVRQPYKFPLIPPLNWLSPIWRQLPLRQRDWAAPDLVLLTHNVDEISVMLREWNASVLHEKRVFRFLGPGVQIINHSSQGIRRWMFSTIHRDITANQLVHFVLPWGCLADNSNVLCKCFYKEDTGGRNHKGHWF